MWLLLYKTLQLPIGIAAVPSRSILATEKLN
jgi:hypothetical protein